mgnify:FL=1
MRRIAAPALTFGDLVVHLHPATVQLVLAAVDSDTVADSKTAAVELSSPLLVAEKPVAVAVVAECSHLTACAEQLASDSQAVE